jgi:ubiquinone/menaquinone biosynthesis C-methylase UbiE
MLPNQQKETSTTQNYHYFDKTYDVKGRFSAYWHQINEVISLEPAKVLEVGIGTGLVADYLKVRGIDITTIDVVHGLKPNITASVLAIPFSAETFDIITCYEVLEHLPYSDFPKALKELARVARKHVILSLPDVTTVYRLLIELPKMKPIKRLIPHPFPRSTVHRYDGEHHWEIGKTGYALHKIKLDITRSRFKILKTYRVFEFCYNRFFLLEKLP